MSLPDNVIQALRAGRKVTAIKLLREATGLGLTEAKVMIDGFIDDGRPLDSEMLTPTVESSKKTFGWLGTVAVVSTLVWMLINSVSMAGSTIILLNLEGYQRATFTVEELRYRDDSESGLFWGFVGQVNGKSTRFYAPSLADAKLLGARKLRILYPVGHRFDVWYNPDVTETLFQQRTLHVLPYTADLKKTETQKIVWWLNYCLLPFVVALVIVRKLEMRQKNEKTPFGI